MVRPNLYNFKFFESDPIKKFVQILFFPMK